MVLGPNCCQLSGHCELAQGRSVASHGGMCLGAISIVPKSLDTSHDVARQTDSVGARSGDDCWPASSPGAAVTPSTVHMLNPSYGWTKDGEQERERIIT